MSYIAGGLTYSIRLSQHPEYGLRIAEIIGLWSTIEHLLTNVFSVLAGTDTHKSAVLVGSVEASRARLGLIRAAGEMTLKKHPLLAQFTATVDAASKCLRDRNTYAHAVYALNDRGQLCRVHIGYDTRESPKAVTVLSTADLDRIIGRLVQTYQQTMALIEALWRELPREYMQALQALNLQRMLLARSSTEGSPLRSDSETSPPPPAPLEE